MKRIRAKWFWIWMFLISLLFVGGNFVLADELILEFDPDEGSLNDVNNEIKADADRKPNAVRDQFKQGYKQLFEFNEQEIQGLKAVLFPLQQDVFSIDAQIQLIAAQIERIKRQETLVLAKILGLEQLNEKFVIQDRLLTLEMKGAFKKFEKLLVLFYRIKREFVMENGKFNLSQLFSNSSSPADFLFQDYLLQKIQGQLADHMNNVSYQQLQLSVLRDELNMIKDQLDLFRDRIKNSAIVLSEQAEFKKQLLFEKKDEQRFFDKALVEAIAEQKIISQRIQELAGGVSQRAYQDFPVENFEWPVLPALGISAGFKDESYFARFGINHNAIDIPTDQLTPVKAALAGKVLKAHDGGNTGYSYLQLAHRDGFSTVYGHLYAFRVKEGDVIQQGQIIGLSGGALGTNGAGRLTTGPHVHFEILKDGKYVNPVDYLVKQ